MFCWRICGGGLVVFSWSCAVCGVWFFTIYCIIHPLLPPVCSSLDLFPFTSIPSFLLPHWTLKLISVWSNSKTARILDGQWQVSKRTTPRQSASLQLLQFFIGWNNLCRNLSFSMFAAVICVFATSMVCRKNSVYSLKCEVVLRSCPAHGIGRQTTATFKYGMDLFYWHTSCVHVWFYNLCSWRMTILVLKFPPRFPGKNMHIANKIFSCKCGARSA